MSPIATEARIAPRGAAIVLDAKAGEPGLKGMVSPAAGQPATSDPSACLAYTSPSLVPKTMSALPSPSRSACDGEGAVALGGAQLDPHGLGDVRLGRDLAGEDLRHRIVGVDAAVAGELMEARWRGVA